MLFLDVKYIASDMPELFREVKKLYSSKSKRFPKFPFEITAKRKHFVVFCNKIHKIQGRFIFNFNISARISIAFVKVKIHLIKILKVR